MNTNEINVSSIPELLGSTLTRIDVSKGVLIDNVVFTRDDGKKIWMGHHQDCCESVDIEDITGDTDDLIGSPLIVAEVRTMDLIPDYKEGDRLAQATFYELRTARGGVTIRWHGESNGFYSVKVDIIELKK